MLALAGLVLLDPHAPAAMAAQAPPPPVTVPSSVVGSLDEATALERSRAIGNTVSTVGTAWRAPVSASGGLFKSVAGAPSPFAAGVAGFFIGYEGTNLVMRLAGVDDVGFEALWDYYGPAAAADYVPNVDVAALVVPPGWVGQPAWPGWWRECTALQCRYDNITQSEFLSELDGPPQSTGGGVYASTLVGSGSPYPLALLTSGTWDPSTGSWYLIGHLDDGGTVQSPVVAATKVAAGELPSGGGLSVPSGRYLVSVDLRDASGQVVATWYPVGSPSRPAEVDSDPLRSWRTDWTCTGGGTGSASSMPFRESDPTWPQFPEVTCPAGLIATEVNIWEVTPGLDDALVYSWTVPAEVASWANDFPECLDGSCVLDLRRVDPATGAAVSCLSNPAACVDWWSDPAKADNYRCVYGSHAVALDECAVYRPTFNVATGAPTVDDQGQPHPASETEPYGDPGADGEPVPTPDPSGSPAPDDGCPPPFEFTAGGIGYWVTKGAQCALAWAFVPSADTVTAQVQATKTEVLSRPPLSLAGPIAGTLGGLADGWGTGCEGNVADFDPWGEGRLAFPCTPPQSPPLLVLYSITSLALVVSTGFYVWSLLVSAMNGRGGGEG